MPVRSGAEGFIPCLFPQGADPVSEVVHGPLGRGRAPGPHPGGNEGRYPLGAALCSSGTTGGLGKLEMDQG